LSKFWKPHYKNTIKILIYFYFCRGKISYHTEPPEDNEIHISSAIVTEVAQEFDLEKYDKENLAPQQEMDTEIATSTSAGKIQ